MRAIGEADRGRGPRNFLNRDAMFEITEPRAAIFLLDGNPMQAEVTEFRPQVAGKGVALVDFGGARRDLMGREVADRLANRIRGLAEIEIEHPLRVGDHLMFASGRMRGSRAKPFVLRITMSRAEDAEKSINSPLP